MRNSGIFWGGLLIVVGVAFLLNTLGVLPGIPWRVIWPVALILLGLVFLINAAGRRGEETVEALALQLKGFESAAVDLRYGAGRLTLDAGAAPDELLNGLFAGGVTHRLSDDGGVARVTLSSPADAVWDWGGRRTRDWAIHLNGDVPLELTMDTGAAEVRADLSATQTRRLFLRTGASSTEITLPAAAGHSLARVEGGAGSVRLVVPPGVAARIEGGAAVGRFDVDGDRFPRAGSVWQSPDYETAANRAEIAVTFGAGEVQVR